MSRKRCSFLSDSVHPASPEYLTSELMKTDLHFHLPSITSIDTIKVNNCVGVRNHRHFKTKS